VEIETIEVLPVEVVPEHPLEDSFRINHGNQAKLKMLSKKIRPIIFFVGQKSQDSFHAVRSWSFTRMNSGRDDNPGFIYFEGSLSFFKDSLNTFHSFLAYIPLISDRHEVDLASFTGSDEGLLMEIDVRVIFVL
jgi:hypothetical protein